MNVPKIRQDFPFFQRPSPVIYLDNAATTQKPAAVIDAMNDFYRSGYANVHRALYPLGEAATASYEAAREAAAAFINAANASEIIFTKGTTEGINLLASSWAMPNLKPGDEIVITAAEHHANLLPWQRVAQQTGARLVIIPIDHDSYHLVNPESALTKQTKLVAITHDSNVIGPVWNHATNQLQNFINKAKACGAIVLLDAAQSIMHQRLDVQALGVDALVFSGHKMLGPTGIGVLYLKRSLADQCQPYQVGGTMVREVTLQHASWAEPPHKFEAGTPPIAEAIGLHAAITYLTTNIDFIALQKHEADLCQLLIDGLQTIPGIAIAGNLERLRSHGHLVSFALVNHSSLGRSIHPPTLSTSYGAMNGALTGSVHPHDLAAHLGANGFAVRAGHHCAQPLVTALGFESLLRASFTVYNTKTDVELFITQLQQSIAALIKMML